MKLIDDRHMTPFLQALYDCVQEHGPEDNLELLRDLFTACGATAVMVDVVRENPDMALDVMREVLAAAITAHNAVMAMREANNESIIWMQNNVIGDA